MQLARDDVNQHQHNWYQSLVNLQFLFLLQKDAFGIFTQLYVVNFILIYHLGWICKFDTFLFLRRMIFLLCV